MLRFVIISLFLVSASIPQQLNRNAATVGGLEIKLEEFKTRYEMMPHVSKMQFNDDSSKYHFLYSLIAEKLWALEAADLGYHLNETIVMSLKPLEKMYVRDALFRQEIEKQISISEPEIQTALRKNSVTLKVLVMATVDSQKAFDLYNEISKGEDPLAKISSKYPGQFEQNLIDVNFGQFEDTNIEDALFNLPADSVTAPFRTQFGWFLFKVTDRTKRSPESAVPNERAVVKDLLRQRKARVAGTEYLSQLLKDVTVNTDSALFFLLADELSKVISEKVSVLDSLPAEGLHIYEPEITRVINRLNEKTLNGNLVLFEENPLTVKEFLYDLIVTGFSTTSEDKRVVASRLNRSLKYFIEQELIAREGYRQGLNNHSDVENSISKWRENFLAQLMRNSFLDSVNISREDVYDYYVQLQNKPEAKVNLKIVEVLTENLDDAALVLDEINAGKDMREIAEQYSVRESTKTTRGEFNWFTADEHGEIGRIASTMEVNDVYGPLKVSGGFSIFQLTAKRSDDTIPLGSFEEVYDQLKNQLTARKLYSKYMTHTARLAYKYGFEIDHNAIRDLNVSNISMFTYRHMGFGGRITAFPLTSPFYEWVYDYYFLVKENP